MKICPAGLSQIVVAGPEVQKSVPGRLSRLGNRFPETHSRRMMP